MVPFGDQRPPRVTATMPAATSTAATPNTNVRFFIPFVEPDTQFPPSGLPLFLCPPSLAILVGMYGGTPTISRRAAHPGARLNHRKNSITIIQTPASRDRIRPST